MVSMARKIAETADYRRLFFSPVSLSAFICLLYLGIVLVQANSDPLDLVRIGTRFSEGASPGTEGYDGQFIYYIARDSDPATVAQHLDVPAYRYQRILLPLLAKVASIGQEDWLPWVIPLINIIAHIWAVFLLTKLLEIWKVNRWYALAYGLWVGALLGLRLDLPEPLAFSLVITAIWLDLKGKKVGSWLFFVLALFTKETSIFFAAAQGLVYLASRRWKDALGLTLLAGIPFLVFHLWLLKVFGSLGFGLGGAGSGGIEFIPFFGLWRVSEYSLTYFLAIIAIYVPAFVIPAIWGLYASAKRWLSGSHEFITASLFLNAAIYPFLPRSLYIEPLGTFRLATGLVLAILLFAARYRLNRVLNFSLFWLFLNALLIVQIIR
jgi:hypothetical protein